MLKARQGLWLVYFGAGMESAKEVVVETVCRHWRLYNTIGELTMIRYNAQPETSSLAFATLIS